MNYYDYQVYSALEKAMKDLSVSIREDLGIKPEEKLFTTQRKRVSSIIDVHAKTIHINVMRELKRSINFTPEDEAKLNKRIVGALLSAPI